MKTSEVSLSIPDVQGLWNRLMSFFLQIIFRDPFLLSIQKVSECFVCGFPRGCISVLLKRKLLTFLLICCSYEKHLTAVGRSVPVSSGALQFPVLYFSCVQKVCARQRRFIPCTLTFMSTSCQSVDFFPWICVLQVILFEFTVFCSFKWLMMFDICWQMSQSWSSSLPCGTGAWSDLLHPQSFICMSNLKTGSCPEEMRH